MKNCKDTIDEEYRNLKSKVEDQIKILQEKLAKNSEIHYHRSINSSKNLQVPSSIQYKTSRDQVIEKNHCKHHCNHRVSTNCSRHSICNHNSCCCSRNNSMNTEQLSLNNIIKNSKVQQIYKTEDSINQKLSNRNIMLEQAFIKSVENQRQLAQSIKLLAEKLQKLQGNSQAKSNSQFSEDNAFNFKFSGSKEEENSQNLKDEPIRTKSLTCKQFRTLGKSKSKKNNIPINLSKFSSSKAKKQKIQKQRNGSKESNEYLSKVKSDKKFDGISLNLLKDKKDKNIKQNKKAYNNHSKLNQDWRSDYFGNDNLCPVHFKPTLCDIESKKKQVYKDSIHRNRKHERDHLIESFKQQQIARRKLMSKILQSEGLHLKNR